MEDPAPYLSSDSVKNLALEQAAALERSAHLLKEQGQVQKAYDDFHHAARLYSKHNENIKSAFCFAAAATCWNIHTGIQPLKNAAESNRQAARQAMIAKNYDYALTLYREAALLYEKEGDTDHYSECFMSAKKASRLQSWNIALGYSSCAMSLLEHRVNWKERLDHLCRVFFSWLSYFTWGHGEEPWRVLISGGNVVLFSTLGILLFGDLSANGQVVKAGFWDVFYFALVSFSTVGYGDYVPVGAARVFAVFTFLSGTFLMPLFVIGLTRKYLRVK